MRRNSIRLPAVIMALLLCLTACGNSKTANDNTATSDSAVQTPADARHFTVNCCVGQTMSTLDPARTIADGGETVLYHLYENLLRWADDGSGYAVLAPGQAESYTVECDYAGNATYTFTLRSGILWSDGQPVTARDFVASWQRLADPARGLPHSSLLRMVAGYDQVQETGDVSLLAVSAPDDTTFVVTLNGSCAWFLEEVCAGAHTMPVRQELLDEVDWSSLTDEVIADRIITNGPFVAAHFSGTLVTLLRSDTYYAKTSVHPSELRFTTARDAENDYAAYLDGQLQLLHNPPLSASQELAADPTWLPDPVTSVFGVMLNTLAPPFDDPDIRRAFYLAIDPQAVTDALGDVTFHPADGLVPWGVTDYGKRTDGEADQSNTDTLPDPNAEPVPETAATYWDFRSHSQELVTAPEGTDYAVSCLQAQALMAQAGYAGGGGFPVVEYIYEESGENRAVALALQKMWQEQLGVTVTVRGLSRTEYETMLIPVEPAPAEGETAPGLPATASFQLAGRTFTADRNDAEAFLRRWHSADAANVTGYSSAAFDILLDSAAAAVSAEARDAYLHDAEAILLTDAPVIPLFYPGSSYLLSDGLTGLYRLPDGVYFLAGLELVSDS